MMISASSALIGFGAGGRLNFTRLGFGTYYIKHDQSRTFAQPVESLTGAIRFAYLNINEFVGHAEFAS